MIKSRKIWFKSLSFSLGLLFLISSIGMSIDIHYCQGNIKSIGIYAPAEKCSGEMDVAVCSSHSSQTEVARKPCCSDKQFFYQSGIANKTSDFVNTQTIPVVTILPDNGNTQTSIFHLEDVLIYNGSDPPLVVKDLNILYDTFLI